ncbi:KCNB2 [Symbiodinium natans]|uniref:KCNB2 protein n=1 Tax=Symbiodinium natans TaxID=878477 RepID=A0A812UK18_9DINO|nr:KCNB2 [Symbiodinium natans]
MGPHGSLKLVDMNDSFGVHFDQLIARVRSELLQHYERDIQVKADSQSFIPVRDEVLPPISAKPQFLRLSPKKQWNSSEWGPVSSPLSNFRQSPVFSKGDSSSSDEDEPHGKIGVVHHRLTSKSAVSDGSQATQPSADSPNMELKTPKARFPQLEAQLPRPPSEGEADAPPVSPQLLLTTSGGLCPMLPNNPEEADGCLGETGVDLQDQKGNQIADKSSAKSSASSSSSSSSSSSASFTSTTDNNASGNEGQGSRKVMKRASESSIPSFFDKEAASSLLWQFLEDPDSSPAAFYFATAWNYFITLSIVVTILQGSQSPIIPASTEGFLQVSVEVALALEFLAHIYASTSCYAFVKSPYNIIDFCALLPLVIRIIAGVETPTLAENAVVHYTLVCFVPLIRLLKLVRRFKKLQLLLHVLSSVIDALKLLLFLISIIVLIFATALYITDQPDNIDSLPLAIWMCTVTVTTVGYGDVTPSTWPARGVAGILCFISVLFMAMPISVVGNAMSQTWADRNRILLVTRARQRLKNWGVSASDMPRLFKKFDQDGNGELGMDEFCVGCKSKVSAELVAMCRPLGAFEREASDLFVAFDTAATGIGWEVHLSTLLARGIGTDNCRAGRLQYLAVAGDAAASFDLTLPVSATVGELAVQLAEREGCESELITIVSRGKPLKDSGAKLSDLGGGLEEKLPVVYIVRKPASSTGAVAAATPSTGAKTTTAASSTESAKPSKPGRRVILMLRHGQCCHEGERDELKELTQHGHKQAEDTARFISQLFAAGKFPSKRALLHSTSRRARETAAKLPVHIQDLEVWNADLLRETDPTNKPFRAEEVFNRLFATPEAGDSDTLIIVAHNNIILYMLMRAAGVPIERAAQAWTLFHLRHASITRVDVSSLGTTQVVSIGASAHIADTAITWKNVTGADMSAWKGGGPERHKFGGRMLVLVRQAGGEGTGAEISQQMQSVADHVKSLSGYMMSGKAVVACTSSAQSTAAVLASKFKAVPQLFPDSILEQPEAAFLQFFQAPDEGSRDTVVIVSEERIRT